MGENCYKCGSEQLSKDCPNPRRNTGTAWVGDEEGGGDDDGWFTAYTGSDAEREGGIETPLTVTSDDVGCSFLFTTSLTGRSAPSIAIHTLDSVHEFNGNNVFLARTRRRRSSSCASC